MKDLDLAVAFQTGTDTDSRDFKAAGDGLCQVCRNQFEDDRECACILNGKCVVDHPRRI